MAFRCRLVCSVSHSDNWDFCSYKLSTIAVSAVLKGYVELVIHPLTPHLQRVCINSKQCRILHDVAVLPTLIAIVALHFIIF